MEPSHAIVKALADPERLRVFAQIALAGPDGLDAAEIDAKALPRLLKAGIVLHEHGRLCADPAAFQRAARAAREANPDAPADAAAEVAALYSEGRITTIPVNRRPRVTLLRDLAERLFAFDRAYTEKEITEALAAEHDDPVQLRRYMIDELFLDRTTDGSEYHRREAPPI